MWSENIFINNSHAIESVIILIILPSQYGLHHVHIIKVTLNLFILVSQYTLMIHAQIYDVLNIPPHELTSIAR